MRHWFSQNTGDRTYAVIVCPVCGKPRVVNMDSKRSKCPYCSKTCEHIRATRIYEDNDQRACRDAIIYMHNANFDTKKNTDAIEIADPYSTLIYKYEHCSTIEEKLEMLSKGLSELKGTFTIEDLEDVDPRNAKKLLKAMCEGGYIIETNPGEFRT